VPTPTCARCGAATAWPLAACRECNGRRLGFATARSAYVYAGPARAFVAAWKERGLRHLAPLAAELVAERLERCAADAITSVPADAVRQLERGIHPAEALARELARAWSVEHRNLLARTRTVGRQASLTLAERRTNVRDAFAPSGRAPGHVLLVDDVYTTGATASGAAAALRRAGARRVDVVTFARAVRF
jgi:ComF family protein